MADDTDAAPSAIPAPAFAPPTATPRSEGSRREPEVARRLLLAFTLALVVFRACRAGTGYGAAGPGPSGVAQPRPVAARCSSSARLSSHSSVEPKSSSASFARAE